jgi:hypothetical protein
MKTLKGLQALWKRLEIIKTNIIQIMKKIIIQSKKNTQDIAQNNTNILKAEDNRNDGMSQKPSVPSGSPGVFAGRILV